LPYHGTTPCKETEAREAKHAATAPVKAEKPWWMFWKWWE
jgi:hypothetical protein